MNAPNKLSHCWLHVTFKFLNWKRTHSNCTWIGAKLLGSGPYVHNHNQEDLYVINIALLFDPTYTLMAMWGTVTQGHSTWTGRVWINPLYPLSHSCLCGSLAQHN